jgi:hypothetical protein
MGVWTGGGLLSGSKQFALPITEFQSNILWLLAAQRSPDSYIAGGVAINREGPRISADIDIFHNSAARLEGAVKADEAALTGVAEGRKLKPELFQALLP